MASIITDDDLTRRKYWVEEIRKLSGVFSDDSNRLENELREEITNQGVNSLISHLRLCGDIPESYGHDSSEEKLYSKYTDALLSEAFKSFGLRSIVLKERADSADVEAFSENYSFVADAKAFRLSRTAKNQKDFKVQAMDGWKRGKPYAVVICPIYQLPTKGSQIYEQASAKNVCVFTYSHLSVIVNFAITEGDDAAKNLLLEVFKTVEALSPSKDASLYWLAINRTMLGFSSSISGLWYNEKQAAIDSIKIAKEEAVTYLAQEREKIMQMSHDEALNELIKVHKIESRISVINSVTHNNILEAI